MQKTVPALCVSVLALMFAASCDNHETEALNAQSGTAQFESIAQDNFNHDKAHSRYGGKYRLDLTLLCDTDLFMSGDMPTGFPMVISADAADLKKVSSREESVSPHLLSALDEMVRLGFLTRKSGTMPDRGRIKPVYIYDLTAAGAEVFGPQPNLSVNVGEWEFSRFLGNSTVRECATSDGQAFERSRVSFAYHLGSQPEWLTQSPVLISLFKVPEGELKEHVTFFRMKGSEDWQTSGEMSLFQTKERDPLGLRHKNWHSPDEGQIFSLHDAAENPAL